MKNPFGCSLCTNWVTFSGRIDPQTLSLTTRPPFLRQFTMNFLVTSNKVRATWDKFMFTCVNVFGKVQLPLEADIELFCISMHAVRRGIKDISWSEDMFTKQNFCPLPDTVDVRETHLWRISYVSCSLNWHHFT